MNVYERRNTQVTLMRDYSEKTKKGRFRNLTRTCVRTSSLSSVQTRIIKVDFRLKELHNEMKRIYTYFETHVEKALNYKIK